ncbi:MAG: anhydro-N-acetylmuramic acid kinase [Candidatus Hydrogenedentota bacterium]
MVDAIRKKPTRFAIGLTAGAAARGIDAVLVRIKGSGPGSHIKLVRSKHFPHSQSLRARMLVSRKDAREVALLSFDLGDALADAAEEMQRLAHKELVEVDFVASAGHTVAHNPARGYETAAVGTLQVGESAVIAERTQLPVVSDFQARDMAAGGQGGPITTYGDWILFSRPDRTILRLHLGGNTSMTVVSPAFEMITSFDTGPGMTALDGTVRILTGGTADLDEDGEAASKGMVIDEFLEYLLDQPFFSKVPPKSTAYGEFGTEHYLRDALTGRRVHSFEDLTATVTAAVSYSIVRAYNRFVKPQFGISRVVVSGGGVNNGALMQRLRNAIPEATFRSSDEYGLPHQCVDAMAIAILGNETLCGKASNVPHATGAQKPVPLGRITPA